MRPTQGIEYQVLPGHLTAGCTFPFAHAAVLPSRGQVLEKRDLRRDQKRKEQERPPSLWDIKPRGLCGAPEPRRPACSSGHPAAGEVKGATKDYLKVAVLSGSGRAVCTSDPAGPAEPLHRPATRGVKASKAGRCRVATPRQGKKTEGDGAGTDPAAPAAVEVRATPSRRTTEQQDFETRDYDETERPAERHRRDQSRTWKKGWPMDRCCAATWGVGKDRSGPARRLQSWVMGGKRCAICHTTCWRKQHYNTILSRMEAFPVKVEMMSRFRTAKSSRRRPSGGLRSGQCGHRGGAPPAAVKDVKVPRPSALDHHR